MNEAPHVLPDLLRAGLDVVICGSAAGRRSAEVGAYYAGPGNKFWRILAETGLTPRRLAPEEFVILPDFGIGLTDLAKRYSGPDAGLRAGDDDVAALRAKIEATRPRVLAFNGKRAAARVLGSAIVHGRSETRIGETVLFALPSTAGLASRWWDPAPWHDLARVVRDLRA